MAFSSSCSKHRFPTLRFCIPRPFPPPFSLSTLKNGLSRRSSPPPLTRPHACNAAEKMRHRTPTQDYSEVASQLSSPRPTEKNACSDGGSVAVFDEETEPSRGKRQNLQARNRGFRHRPRKYKEMEFGSAVDEKMVRRSKKAKFSKPEAELRVRLDTCSKTGDAMGAIALYDSAVRDGVKLEQYHYNVLLYLCSSAAIGVVHPAKSGSGIGSFSSVSNLSANGEGMSNLDAVGVAEMNRVSRDDSTSEVDGYGDKVVNRGTPLLVSDDVRDYARNRGFEIYEKMCLEEVPMSEAALTSVARMAMSMGDGDMAFEIVKRMNILGVTHRLRSYGPALFAYCNVNDIEKAFEVEAHMLENSVYPEEPELKALLKASVRARRGDKVYYLLHKLRTSVRQVSPSTADVIEEWFKSSPASRVGKRKWDKKMVAQAIEYGGGGWHGLGWLGKGKWKVERTNIDADGLCLSCGEKLVTLDLDPVETENFAKSVVSIACKRERNSNFQKFQKWLDYYGPFEAVVDAANVGLFSQRKFSTSKVNAVVNAIRQKLPSKIWPLIIIHNKRIFGGRMDEPINARLIEKWKNADAIYATPTGSNDDWYWLFAAIKCKSLIVTNDEMRDHIFQILGNDFFPKWKERHQVHFSFRDGNFEFHMPPPCSVVIQESDKGHWHIPIISEHDSGNKRTWLCVTRGTLDTATKETSIPPKEPNFKKKVKRADSYARHNNRTKLFTDDSYQGQCQPFAEHAQEMLVSTQRNTDTSELLKPRSIIFDIEAAEKLCDCVIDFQI